VAIPGKKKKGLGKKKAAQLLVALGPEVASAVFHTLGQDEIAELSAEVAAVGVVSAGERQAVLREFFEMAEEQRLTVTGGSSYAEVALSRSFGEERASEILDRIKRGDVKTPSFIELEQSDPIIIRDLLRDEHPQTIAVVLAHLSTEQAGAVVAALDNDLRVKVLARLAKLGLVQHEMVTEIQSTLQKRMAQRPEVQAQIDGARMVALILGNTEKDVEEMVLGQFSREDPQLFEQIQRQLFLFEDLVLLDGRSVQKVLRGVDAKTLAVAMKAATEEVQQVIYTNMSKRAGAVLKGELEVLGPLPIAEVEKAQAEIIDIVRTLEREGEIVVPRGDADQMV
jgi:flagellar motor switch protein FliG